MPTEGHRHRRHRGRPEQAQGRLLELRPRADHVSAPGGDPRDFFGTPEHANENLILAAYPESRRRRDGDINPTDAEHAAGRRGLQGRRGYYQ